MKLHELQQARMNLVGRYAAGLIEVNGRTLTAPCILSPGFVHAEWIADVSQLTLDALQPVWPLQPRILLVGTAMPSAASLRALRAPLAARDVALEVMDLGAACRTYNVLAQEDRPVAALLFP